MQMVEGPEFAVNRSPPLVTDAQPKFHRWTTEMPSAAFAVVSRGPLV